MRSRIELYTDNSGAHRWRKKAANYFITAASTQGYTHGLSAIRNLEKEQGGTYYRAPAPHDQAPFVRGKRRIGVLRRDNGQEIPVLELEPKRVR